MSKKDPRLTPKQIDKLLANPVKIDLNIQPKPEPQPLTIVIKGSDKDYDTLNAAEHVKTFCAFIKDLVSRYEENERRQNEAEIMESDLKHAIELTQRLTEKEKKTLYQKLTDVLQTRRACKSENEILAPLYTYFSDKVLLNKLSQLQGSVTTMKDVVTNRSYSCRTSILDDFRM